MCTLLEFINVTVHRELSPDKSTFMGEKQHTSRRSHGRRPCERKYDVSALSSRDRMCRSTQTGPSTSLLHPRLALNMVQ